MRLEKIMEVMSGGDCLAFLKTNAPAVHMACIVMLVDALDKEVPTALIDERLRLCVIDVIRKRRYGKRYKPKLLPELV